MYSTKQLTIKIFRKVKKDACVHLLPKLPDEHREWICCKLFFAKAIFSKHHSMMVSEFPKEKGTHGVQNGIHELEVKSLKKYIQIFIFSKVAG